jgi:hypothetical protein
VQTQEWLADAARELISTDSEFAHPDVIAHWKRLAEGSTQEGA